MKPSQPALVAIGVSAAISAAILWWPAQESADPSPGLAREGAARAPVIRLHPAVGEASAAAALYTFAPQASDVPAEASAGATPAVPDGPPVLVGVSNAGKPVAYLTAGGQSWRAERGDTIAGWRVATIGKTNARLVKRGKVLDLKLYQPRTTNWQPPAFQPPPAYQPPAAGSVAGSSPSPANAPQPQQQAGPPPGVSPRFIPPPPPAGKRYWVGPPGSTPPPGFVPFPAPPRR